MPEHDLSVYRQRIQDEIDRCEAERSRKHPRHIARRDYNSGIIIGLKSALWLMDDINDDPGYDSEDIVPVATESVLPSWLVEQFQSNAINKKQS